MKNERTLVTFECDNCKKKSNEFEQPAKMPYESGWRFLYHAEIKIGRENAIQIKDKHFCSDECLLSFIKEKFEEDRK